MNNTIVLLCDDLKKITGYQRPADVARCLRDQGVQVFNGKSGPWTTTDLINQAGGLEITVDTVPEELNPRHVI